MQSTSNYMKIEIQIDDNIDETKIVVCAKELNKEISELIEKISSNNETIKVEKNEQIYILKQDDIEAVFTEENKIIVKTENEKYISKKRIYEMESILNKSKFVRISNSEIINFDKVKKIDMKILGTIEIHLFSGYITYASRRYIKKIKDFLN